VPIITTTVLTGGQTQENVSYLDVGIKLDVEPIIRPNDEIDLKIRLEVSTITEEFETSAGGRFVELGTRNADTTLRLSDGETQIIGGLIEDEERIRTVKVPGLGEIPVIGRLFSSKSTDAIKTDILLSITPHIVRRVEVPDEDVRSIWSGREDAPSIVPLIESFPSPEGPEEGEKPLPPIPPPPGVFPGLPEVPPPGFPPQP
jgi:general secretion pathway protein D